MVNVSPPSSFAIDVPDALLARARRGEAAAFEQLYRLFERPVYTLALRLAGQREEAQDILQETMLKLFDRLSGFRGDSPFWGWLRQIAVNEALMQLRRRGRFLAEGGAFEEEDFACQDLLLPPRAADAAILAQALGQLPGATRSARNLLGDLKQDQKVQLRYAREGKVRDATVKADSIRRVMVINRDGGARKHMGVLPPDVAMEIERIGPIARKCAAGDDDCGMPALFEAFRWQGLNLASVDASLGRYFGTSAGVLVLSSGPELKALQPGDVIRRVNGAAVSSPREVMRELREKEAGTRLQLDVLRDRKPVPVTLTVPKSRPLPFMIPPPAPAPPPMPAPPSTPRAAHAAPPPPAAPPAPPTPPATPRRDRPGDVPGELQQATEIHVD